MKGERDIESESGNEKGRTQHVINVHRPIICPPPVIVVVVIIPYPLRSKGPNKIQKLTSVKLAVLDEP